MAFNFKTYINQFLVTTPGYNDAILYGVSTVRPVAQGSQCFTVIGVHHLSGLENHGMHNVFCEVLDEEGKRIQGVVLIVSNVNNTVHHVAADKPDNEPGASIPMWGNDTLTISVSGNMPSEKVTGLHTRHPDEEAGNTLGHHSFLVVWQLKKVGSEPVEEEEEEPEPVPVEDWRKQFSPNRLAVIEECKRYPGGLLTGIIVKMSELLDERE